MAALTVSALRQRLAAQLEGWSDWSESPLPAGRLEQHPGVSAVKVFAVSVPATRRHLGEARSATGALVDSEVVVRWLHRVKTLGSVAQLDAVLDVEQALLLRVLAVDKSNLAIRWEDARRNDAGDAFVGELAFTCTHELAFVTNPA